MSGGRFFRLRLVRRAFRANGSKAWGRLLVCALPALLLGTGCERLVSTSYKGGSDLLHLAVRAPQRGIHALVEAGDEAGARSYLRRFPHRVNSPAHALAGRRPLHLAVERQDAEMMKLLLDLGAEVNGRDHLGRTPLYLAVIQPKGLTLMTRLLDAGADPALADRIGITPLHLAVYRRETDKARELLRYGAPVNAATRGEGLTPLMLATVELDEPMAILLLNHGADPNRVSAQGATALDLALQRRGNRLVKALRTRGAKRGTGHYSGAEFEDFRFD